jgi:hypothetical protein
MAGELKTGKTGIVGVAVDGTGEAVSVEAGTVGATVGTVPQASAASETTSPQTRILNLFASMNYSFDLYE